MHNIVLQIFIEKKFFLQINRSNKRRIIGPLCYTCFLFLPKQSRCEISLGSKLYNNPLINLRINQLVSNSLSIRFHSSHYLLRACLILLLDKRREGKGREGKGREVDTFTG